MKSTDILKAIGEVDEEVIVNAKKNQNSNKKVLITVGTIAACAVFGCIGAIMLNMPQNTISEPSKNGDTDFDGNWYYGNWYSEGESKILTGDYSVPEKSVQEKSSQEFETSFANEGSETALEQIPVEMYKIKDGKLVHDTVMLDASPQIIFNVWKSENAVGEEVRLVNVKIEDNGTDIVSEYSGVGVVTHQKGDKTIYTITVTKNLENYYEIEDFYGYRSKELVLESLEKTMTSICDSKPDEYRLILSDNTEEEKTESKSSVFDDKQSNNDVVNSDAYSITEIIPTNPRTEESDEYVTQEYITDKTEADQPSTNYAEESESNRIDPNDIQYNDQGEILE